MAGSAPQPSLSGVESGVTSLPDKEKMPSITRDPQFVNLQVYYELEMEDDDAIDVMLHNSGDTSLAGQQNKPNTTKAPLLVDPSSYNYQVPIYNPIPDLQMAGYASPRVSLSQLVSGAKSPTYQEKKPNITKVPEFVDLQIYYQQDGSRTSFRAKRNIKLRELVVQYCTQHSLDMKVLRVLFDGTRLRQELTPQELGMEDGDEIEVMINANGGSRII